MKEVKKCRCGKASMTYEVIGEDLWSAVAVNTKLRHGTYCMICQCELCFDNYDKYDPVMVKLFK